MAAFTFDCQKCGLPIMAAEDMAGKRGRCPHCSTTFSIPDPQTAIAPRSLPVSVPNVPDVNRTGPGWRELEVDDEPRQRPMTRSRSAYDDDDHDDDDFPYDRGSGRELRMAPGWSTVASGLSLMRTAMIIYIVVALVMVLFGLLSFAARGDFGRNRQAEMLLGIVALLGGVTLLVVVILFIVGQCMCCAAPTESRTKGLAVGSAICLFSGVGLAFIGLMFLAVAADRRGGGPGVGVMAAGLLVLAGVCGITCHILLVLFLRAVGRYFRNEQLASSAGTYLILNGIFVAFYLLTLFLAVLASNRNQEAAALGVLIVLLAIGLFVFALILFLFFLDLLARTRTTITRATPGNEPWR